MCLSIHAYYAAYKNAMSTVRFSSIVKVNPHHQKTATNTTNKKIYIRHTNDVLLHGPVSFVKSGLEFCWAFLGCALL